MVDQTPWISSALRATPLFQEAVRLLLALEVDALANLTGLTRGEGGFSSGSEHIEKTAESLHLSETDVTLLLNTCAALYKPAKEERSRDDLIDELERIAKEENWDVDFKVKRPVLLELLGPNEQYDRKIKRGRATDRVMPNLEHILIECDMRMVVGEDDQRLGYVPVLVARLAFDETNAGQSAIWFQISEKMLAEMQSLMEEMRSCVETAKLDFGDKLF